MPSSGARSPTWASPRCTWASSLLPLALLALLRGRRFGSLQPIHLMLLAFMALGALRTIPYLGVHGIDALRDAVTWGYALYAIVVAFVLTEDHLRAGIGIYRRLIPVLLVWVPIAARAHLPSSPYRRCPDRTSRSSCSRAATSASTLRAWRHSSSSACTPRGPVGDSPNRCSGCFGSARSPSPGS